MTEVSKEHNGHTITVTENLRFKVSGPIINQFFESAQSAFDKIDDAVRKHEAQTRKRIALKVLDEDGADAVVTGIHASSGAFLGIKSKRYNSASFYPSVPWIAEVLKRINSLQAEIEGLNKKVQPFCVTKYSFEGRHIVDHGERVDMLVKYLNQLQLKAESINHK